MSDHEQTTKSLPENAYRELNPGEEYKPVMPSNTVFPEVTSWSLIMGLLMAVIFSAAAAYSGLKIGQVFEAAIPISIIAVGASAAARRKNALGQNVIIQSIGASSGVIVAGAVFTIPGLYILQAKYPEIQVDFWQIFFSSLLGGFLGILFLIPFRKYFVKDMHGKLPFPEATATTEILMTGEKGGSQAKLLILSGLIGGLFDFAFASFKLFAEEVTSRIIPAGEVLAEKVKMDLKFNVSALIFSFGYLVGLRYSLIIVSGSLLSWFVLIPLVNEIGNLMATNGTVNPFAVMPAEAIFKTYVRPIGIGAIAMAGIIGIIKSSGVIVSAFKLAAGVGSKTHAASAVERTNKDLKMSFVMLFIFLTLITIFVFLIIGVKITLVQAIVALLTILIISFLFTTVAANAIAIVGTNPVSGMTLMTLILSSVILVAVGLKGWQGMVSSLIIGGIVCTALSMAGGFITDLKVGYWLGSTPAKQQTFKFLGTLVSAATVGFVIFILNEAYGFVEGPGHNDPMIAPQANAMAAIIEPLMSGTGAPWILLSIGAVISILMNWLKVSPLAFALGMFIPLQLNTPLVVGGLLNNWFSKSTKNEKLNSSIVNRGILISSGFIAGAAIFGVIGALLLFFKVDLNLDLWENDSKVSQIIAFIAFLGLLTYFIWESFNVKDFVNPFKLEFYTKIAIKLFNFILIIRIVDLILSIILGIVLISVNYNSELNLNFSFFNSIISFFMNIVIVTSLCLIIFSGLIFFNWYSRAFTEIKSRGEQFTFSKGWALIGPFIPILNLYIPFITLKEIFINTKKLIIKEISFKSSINTSLIDLWWILTIVGIFGTIIFNYFLIPSLSSSDIAGHQFFIFIVKIINLVLLITIIRALKNYLENYQLLSKDTTMEK